MKKQMMVLGMSVVMATTLVSQAQEAPVVQGAQDVPAVQEDNSWSFRITPYLWAMGMKGDVATKGLNAPVDLKFKDAVQDLEFSTMVAAEAHKGNWSFLSDLAYVKLDEDVDTVTGQWDVELNQLIVQGGAAYRFVNTPKMIVDLGAGGRYLGLDIDIDATMASANTRESLVDPILLARVRHQCTEKFFVAAVGDVGGFGVSSDLTWSLTGTAGYAMNKYVAFMLGYRYLDYDYDEDGLSYDMATDGLIFGVQVSL